jgi:hypothetical protein
MEMVESQLPNLARAKGSPSEDSKNVLQQHRIFFAGNCGVGSTAITSGNQLGKLLDCDDATPTHFWKLWQSPPWIEPNPPAFECVPKSRSSALGMVIYRYRTKLEFFQPFEKLVSMRECDISNIHVPEPFFQANQIPLVIFDGPLGFAASFQAQKFFRTIGDRVTRWNRTRCQSLFLLNSGKVLSELFSSLGHSFSDGAEDGQLSPGLGDVISSEFSRLGNSRHENLSEPNLDRRGQSILTRILQPGKINPREAINRIRKSN